MKDGRVLITGGDGPTPDQVWSATEIYDPGTGLFQIASGMTQPRTEHAACLLASGEVLVAGGIDWSTTASMLDVEVYDPVSGKYRLLSKLLPNYMVLASFLDLPSGKVFLADAFGGVVLDPVTLTCGPLVPALETRSYSAWVPWPGGALVIGGYNPANPGACYANGEHFVEMENRFKPATFRLSHPRMGHVAMNLDDVTVLVIGGNGSDGLPLSEMEWIKP
jgi:hypothetical protein